MALKNSKFRNVRCFEYGAENCYRDLSISETSGDSCIISLSNMWISLAWKSNTPGPIGILSISDFGRRKTPVPLLLGHSSLVNAMEWNPFHDWILASGASDGVTKIWKLPELGLTGDSQAQITLDGHEKRIDTLSWHPTALNVLATAGSNGVVSLWDIQKHEKACIESSSLGESIDHISWNYDGSQLAMVSRNKKLTIFDPRSSENQQSVESHKGSGKAQRVKWLGDSSFIISTGISTTRDREYKFWDMRSLNSPLATQIVDSSPGVLVPLFDNDTKLMFLFARGDNRIRVFETIEKSPYHFELQSSVDKNPMKGAAMLPKRSCNIMGTEVVRIYRVNTTDSIIPIGFQIPRKSYFDFYPELFPDTPGGDPAMFSEEYFSGENKRPILVSLDPQKGIDSELETENQNDSNAIQTNLGSSTSNNSGKDKAKTRETIVHTFSNSADAIRAANEAPRISRNFFDKNEPIKEVFEYVKKDVKVTHSSHYRHIFGKADMKVNYYENLKVLSEAQQNRIMATNKKWFAVSWEGIAGQVGVFGWNDKGRQPDKISTIETGSSVIDIAWNPFDNDQLATCGDNSLVKLWRIPEKGVKDGLNNIHESQVTLNGHKSKVLAVDYHPIASNLLLTTSMDMTLKIWDLDSQSPSIELNNLDSQIISYSWNIDGSLIATTSRDNKVRIIDLRKNEEVLSFNDMGGPSGSKVAWMGQEQRLVLVGQSKTADRVLQIIDLKNHSSPFCSITIDNEPSLLNPVYDPDTQLLLLWGKGDTSIKFFEINDEKPYVHRILDYSTNVPQVAVSVFPKQLNDVKNVEIFRMFKLTQNYLEPISILVPRVKKSYFQDNIFVPTANYLIPTLTGREWLNGETKLPNYVSLRPEGMENVSSIPIKSDEKRNVIYREDDSMSLEKVNARLRKQLNEMLISDQGFVPGSELEGVDESEWD